MLVLFLILLTSQNIEGLSRDEIVISDTVIFQRISPHVSISHKDWLVTCIFDISNFHNVAQNVYQRIKYLSLTNENIIKKCKEHGYSYMGRDFESIAQEIENVNMTLTQQVNIFSDFHSIHQHRSKQKRAIIPFVGQALQFLFGTSTSAQYDDLKLHVRNLQDNQEVIKHVLKKSLTLLNVTKFHVRENTQNIENLYEHVSAFDLAVKKLTDISLHNRYFITTHSRLNTALLEVRSAIQAVKEFTGNFALKLSYLSLKKLTPTVVPPHQMRMLLESLGKKIPRDLELPINLGRNLWDLYQTLPCQAMLDQNQIFIFIKIPLLHRTNKLSIYKVHNIPVPFSMDNNAHVAKYKLEADGIGVNQDQTYLTLLTEAELKACANIHQPYCKIRGATYQLNINNFCITKLFMQDFDQTKVACVRETKLLSNLPQALYLKDGLWAISTNKVIQFKVFCPELETKIVLINETISLVKFDPKCHAVGRDISLPSNSNVKSVFKFNETMRSLTFQPFKELMIWNVPHQQSKKIAIKKNIDNELTFDTKDLNSELDSIETLGDTKQTRKTAWYVYVMFTLITSVIVALVVVVAVFVYYNRVVIRNQLESMIMRQKGVERNDISDDSPPLRTNNDGHTLEKEVENYNCVTRDMTCAQQTPKGNIEF